MLQKHRFTGDFHDAVQHGSPDIAVNGPSSLPYLGQSKLDSFVPTPCAESESGDSGFDHIALTR